MNNVEQLHARDCHQLCMTEHSTTSGNRMTTRA